MILILDADKEVLVLIQTNVDSFNKYYANDYMYYFTERKYLHVLLDNNQNP
jgi:hypothetical protein